MTMSQVCKSTSNSFLPSGILTVFVLFIVHQSLSGENVWNCRRELQLPIYRSFQFLSPADGFANFLAYWPIGFLLNDLLRNRLRQSVATTCAIALCILLSVAMESLQICLPGRVPSNLDVTTNSLGAACGAILSTFIDRYLNSRHAGCPGSVQEGDSFLVSRQFLIVLLMSLGAWVIFTTSPWFFWPTVDQLIRNVQWFFNFPNENPRISEILMHGFSTLTILILPKCQGIHRRYRQMPLVLVTMMAVLLLATPGVKPEVLIGLVVALVLFLIICVISVFVIRRWHAMRLAPLLTLFICSGFFVISQPSPGLAGQVPLGSILWVPVLGYGEMVSALQHGVFYAWFGITFAACRNPNMLKMHLFKKTWGLLFVLLVAVVVLQLISWLIDRRGIDTSPMILSLLSYTIATYVSSPKARIE